MKCVKIVNTKFVPFNEFWNLLTQDCDLHYIPYFRLHFAGLIRSTIGGELLNQRAVLCL